MTGEYCTDFSWGDYDYDEWSPGTCPKCKGFLPKDFPNEEGVQFQCKKCGAVLEIVKDPDEVEEDMKELDPDWEPTFWSGRICLVPDYAVKIEKVDFNELRKNRPIRKHMTPDWAYGLGFSRRVWKDKDGEFITINGERLNLGDNRISIITSAERKVES